MSFAVGDRVRHRSQAVTGTVLGIFTGSPDIGFHRVDSAERADSYYPVWYEVEYDVAQWHGDILRGHARTVRRNMHTEDVLEPV